MERGGALDRFDVFVDAELGPEYVLAIGLQHILKAMFRGQVKADCGLRDEEFDEGDIAGHDCYIKRIESGHMWNGSEDGRDLENSTGAFRGKSNNFGRTNSPRDLARVSRYDGLAQVRCQT